MTADLHSHFNRCTTLPAEERADLEKWLQESNQVFQGNLLAQKPLDDPALTQLVGFTPSCLQSWLTAARRVPSLLHPDHRAAIKDYSLLSCDRSCTGW